MVAVDMPRLVKFWRVIIIISITSFIISNSMLIVIVIIFDLLLSSDFMFYYPQELKLKAVQQPPEVHMGETRASILTLAELKASALSLGSVSFLPSPVPCTYKVSNIFI